MPKKGSDVSAIPPGKKYLVAWIAAQILGNLPWLAPWLTNQIKAAQQIDATLKAPDASNAIYAGIALIVSTLICFAHKVWKELEADAVKGTAALIKAAPTMAWELIGRCWDALWAFCTRWFIRWGFTRKYLAELRYRYGLFNDKGLGLINASRLDLDRVYVELKGSPDVNLNNPRINPVSREIRDRAPLWEHLRTLRSGFALAIIGPPGSGKTTLLHHVLLVYTRGHQWHRRMRFRLPIFLELRKVVSEMHADPKRSPELPKLIETLWRKDSRSAELTKRMPKGWLTARLKSGRCLLLMDGLDEVADTLQRRMVRDWIETKVIGHPDHRKNLCLVSARPSGYRAAPLEHAQVLEVQPFDWEDTKRFINQWYRATEIVSSGNVDNATTRRRAAEDSQSLLQCLQEMPKLGDLAVNPLLLTMICMVHRYHGALPGSRSQLYDEICQVLLERWRQQRGMEDRFTSQQKLDVLRPLAAWMMQHRVKDVQEDVMLDIISEPIARIGVPAGDKAALAFIRELRDNSGLWLEREMKIWAFAHLSFQEHLCADLWAKSEKFRPDDWTDFLGDSWWRETLLLYAVKTADATPLVQASLDGDASCRAFALKMLGEKINLHADTRARVEDTLVKALDSREDVTFLPAVETYLIRQQENNYVLIDDEYQISGWVTQAEYQAFLLSHALNDRFQATPPHWRDGWFKGSQTYPVLGLTGWQAAEYCEWLNQRFPIWTHRLPLNDKEASVIPDGSGGVLAWMQEGDAHVPSLQAGGIRPTQPGDDSGLYVRDLALAYILDLALAHTFARTFERVRFRVLERARSRSVERDFDSDLSFARALGRASSHAHSLCRNPPRVRAVNVDFETALARALGRSRSFAFAHSLPRLIGFNSARELPLELPLELDVIIEFVLDFVLDVTPDPDLFDLPMHESEVRLGTEDGNLGSRIKRNLNFLRALLPVLSIEGNVFDARSTFRRFLTICFDTYRLLDAKRISPSMIPLETAIRLLIAREEGSAFACEGVRVVRTHRR